MYKAALDFSGMSANFVVANNDELLINLSMNASGRDAAKLPEVIREELAKFNLTIDKIEEFTIGSGPGNFTGLRLAASFISGVSINQKNIKCRCVPSAVALASLAPLSAKELGCIYDGRNREIIYFGLKREANELVPNGKNIILNKDKAEEFFAELPLDILLFAKDEEFLAIEKIVNGDVLARINRVLSLNMVEFLNLKTYEFDNDLTNLIYIRPAVIGA